jgi:Flp pilus assembly protein CpaB
MKQNGLIWWLGAFVLAALAGVLTYSLLVTAAPAAAQNQGADVTVRPVIVAVAFIPFRRSIRAEDLLVRNLPVDSAPEGVATTLEQVVGKMATVDIYANEPILTQQLVTPDIITQQVALSVPDGKIVMAVPTDSKLIGNRLVRPGDHVDLMATFLIETSGQDQSAFAESVALLQDLEIHAIILPATLVEEGSSSLVEAEEGGIFRTSDEKGQSVLLAIDLQDALTIRHVLDVRGLLDLALRPPDDASMATITPVDQFYLAERYNIRLNR